MPKKNVKITKKKIYEKEKPKEKIVKISMKEAPDQLPTEKPILEKVIKNVAIGSKGLQVKSKLEGYENDRFWEALGKMPDQ